MEPVLFEVLESGLKGMGGFATRDIRVGERILAERPLVRWRMVPDLSKVDATSQLDALVDALSQADQEKFFALCQNTEHGTTKCAMGIWKSNAYATDAGHEVGACSSVFALACRLNHDCCPNTHVVWNDRIGMQTVHALREIRKGEEVFVAYLGGDADGTRAARQSQLQQKFGFACTCHQCELSGATLDASETRQRRINEIICRLKTKPSDTLALINERRGLMEQERMPAIWGKSLALLALLEIPLSGGARTRKLAWEVASSAYDTCRVSLGCDSHETMAFESFVGHPSFEAFRKKEKRAKGARAPMALAARGGAASTRSADLGAVNEDLDQLDYTGM